MTDDSILHPTSLELFATAMYDSYSETIEVTETLLEAMKAKT